jgi:phage-related protein
MKVMKKNKIYYINIYILMSLFKKAYQGATKLFGKISSDSPRLFRKISNSFGTVGNAVDKFLPSISGIASLYNPALGASIGAIGTGISGISHTAQRLTNKNNYGDNALDNAKNALEKVNSIRDTAKSFEFH